MSYVCNSRLQAMKPWEWQLKTLWVYVHTCMLMLYHQSFNVVTSRSSDYVPHCCWLISVPSNIAKCALTVRVLFLFYFAQVY